jgi:Putative zinc-finger
MAWSCTLTEERLSDYLDNLLVAEDVTELNRHVDSCADCARLVEQVGTAVRRMRSLEPMEVPPQLILSILDQTVGPRPEKKTGWRGWFAWTHPILQPRFAMGALTCAVTLIIFGYAIGLSPTKIKKGDLAPTNVYRAANRQAHLTYGRAVKYVNDLKVVYEIQSRLRPEESPSRERERESAPAPAPQEKSQQDAHPGRSANLDANLFAYLVTQHTAHAARSPR